MLKQTLRTATIVLLLVPTIAQAQRGYNIMGGGAVSCGVWTKQVNDRRALVQWVMGYVTGLNLSRSLNSAEGNGEFHDVMKGADVTAIEVWMTNYCMQHPLTGIADASMQMIIEASGQ